MEEGCDAFFESGHEGIQPTLPPFLLLVLLFIVIVDIQVVAAAVAFLRGTVGQAQPKNTQGHPWGEKGGGEEGELWRGRRDATPGLGEGLELTGQERGMGKVKLLQARG